jgi:hypothetical protein
LRQSIGPNTGRSERLRLHRNAWAALRSLSPESRRAELAELARTLGISLAARETHRVMSPDEVVALAGSPLTVGAHTVSHPLLPALDRADQAREIEQSARACEEWTGERPTTFAYPYGAFDSTSVELVRAAGFASAVTVNDGVVTARSDPLRLPRLAVTDCSADELERALP